MSSVPLLPVAVVIALLAGCGSKESDAGSTATATVATEPGETASALALTADSVKGEVNIPGFSFADNDVNMDGMKLYPGSKVGGVRVKATGLSGDAKGEVTIDFTSPAAPAKVAEHLAEQARGAGYTVAQISPKGFGGTKEDGDTTDSFALALASAGDATKGQLTFSGRKAN